MSTETPYRDEGRFEWLATSIAGRLVRVQSCPDAEPSHFDGRVIRVAAQHQADHALARHHVAAQALLLGLGSMRPVLVSRLVGRSTIARRYAFLEICRGVRVFGEHLPSAFIQKVQQSSDQWPSTESPEESLRCAALMSAAHEVPEFVGVLKPTLLLRHARTITQPSGLTARERAGELRLMEPPLDLGDAADGESSRLLDRLKMRLGSEPSLGRIFSQLFGRGRALGQEGDDETPGGGAEMPVGRIEQVWQRGVHAIRHDFPLKLASLLVKPEDSLWGVRYPEWDCKDRRYRQDWVRVEEVEPRLEGEGMGLRDVLVPPGRALQRSLASLGCEYEMHRRQPEGAEFDVGALIDYAIDLQSGETPRYQDVYRASRRTRRDLGVVVALDISGSTAEINVSGRPLCESHMRAAWQLGRCFDALGDRVALYGFHSWGREHTCMVRLKGHEEVWDGLVAERFNALQPSGFSRIGSAVRYAEHLLRDSMRLPNRLLILITDGFSYDQDYEGAYAREDTRMALREAQASGTACVCLCIGGSTAAEQLKEVFGAANLLVVDDADQWAGRIGAACREALRSVHWSKRAGRVFL